MDTTRFWNLTTSWNSFPQIEYDTQLYRSKRQAGEVTYEYDRWDKTQFKLEDESKTFLIPAMRRNPGTGANGAPRHLAQGS